MPDLLTPVREVIFSPPTQFLGLAVGPGLLSGFVDLPLLVPGTVNPSYGVSIVLGTYPPAAGRTFTEVPTFHRSWLLVTVWSRTFDGQDIPVERVSIRDAVAELRWFAPGVNRVTLEFAPGYEAHVNYLIILG